MNHSAIVSVSGGVSADSQVCSLHSVTYSEFLGFQAVLNSWGSHLHKLELALKAVLLVSKGLILLSVEQPALRAKKYSDSFVPYSQDVQNHRERFCLLKQQINQKLNHLPRLWD